VKTALSIPDDLFEGAERLARRTNRSRSRLFSDALKEYLARHTPDKVTEATDSVLADLDEVGDAFVWSPDWDRSCIGAVVDIYPGWLTLSTMPQVLPGRIGKACRALFPRHGQSEAFLLWH
jgi:predicted transcriptional regulator